MGQAESGLIICGYDDSLKNKVDSTKRSRSTDLQISREMSDRGEQLSVDRDFELDDKYRRVLKDHWKTIIEQRPDIFHRTMLKCIEASPKLNEIIACGRYCYKDLTKWPKLNRICEQQLKFFENIVIEKNLDPDIVKSKANYLGEKHRTYASYGLKPHFLDLFQQQFTSQLQKIKISDEREKIELIEGWTAVIGYIVERTYYIYSINRGNSNLKSAQLTENE